MLVMTFLLFSLIMWFAGNCILRLFFIAIQTGQILDQLFKWRSMLDNLYASDKAWENNLGKALGDCQICFSFWFMPIWFILYALLGNALNIWAINGYWNILWYVVFHSIGAIVGLGSLIKIKAKTK